MHSVWVCEWMYSIEKISFIYLISFEFVTNLPEFLEKPNIL